MLKLWAGILMTLAIGSAMINGTLAAPWVGSMVNLIAGWIILVGGVFSIFRAFGFKI